MYGDLIRTKKLTFICVPKSNTGTTNYNIEDVETIGQFTGLYDKKGNEIYEGDVVELDEEGRKIFGTSDNLCKKNQLVGFHDGAFMTSRNKYIPYNYDTYLWILKEHIIVVGNIYDNPDLLKEVE